MGLRLRTEKANVVSTPLDHAKGAKRLNLATGLLCGGVPAAILAWLIPTDPERILLGLAIGLVWGNAFEYAYHRYLLHLPGSFLARRHSEHHLATASGDVVEHVTFSSSPLWIVLLFVVNGGPAIALDLFCGFGIAVGILIAFSIYLVALEEIHWRIHLDGWLPPGLRSAREYHLAHHDRPDGRFNVFLPLFDWLFCTVGGPCLAAFPGHRSFH